MRLNKYTYFNTISAEIEKYRFFTIQNTFLPLK